MLTKSHHLEVFAEGVFAIAAMVGVKSLAELDARDASQGYPKLLSHQANSFLYSLCVFALILIWRREQAAVYRNIRLIDNTIVALCFIDMMSACLLPFAMRSMEHHPRSHAGSALLAGLVALFFFSQLLVIQYARYRNLWHVPLPCPTNQDTPTHQAWGQQSDDTIQSQPYDVEDDHETDDKRATQSSSAATARAFAGMRMQMGVCVLYALVVMAIIILAGPYAGM